MDGGAAAPRALRRGLSSPSCWRRSQAPAQRPAGKGHCGGGGGDIPGEHRAGLAVVEVGVTWRVSGALVAPGPPGEACSKALPTLCSPDHSVSAVNGLHGRVLSLHPVRMETQAQLKGDLQKRPFLLPSSRNFVSLLLHAQHQGLHPAPGPPPSIGTGWLSAVGSVVCPSPTSPGRSPGGKGIVCYQGCTWLRLPMTEGAGAVPLVG